ncbi:hypothetical protein PANA5342_1272 [Pantoea ananatis LMG 5342]|nr:hypothetical protein PANA5342_1272 [Pantoea ananatis LMG 5342]
MLIITLSSSGATLPTGGNVKKRDLAVSGLKYKVIT